MSRFMDIARDLQRRYCRSRAIPGNFVDCRRLTKDVLERHETSGWLNEITDLGHELGYQEHMRKMIERL